MLIQKHMIPVSTRLQRTQQQVAESDADLDRNATRTGVGLRFVSSDTQRQVA